MKEMLESKGKIWRQIGLWCVAVLWSWRLLSYWSSFHFFSFPVSNIEISLFLLLGLQISLCSNVKEMVLFRDKEWNYVLLILLITVICLLLAHSKPGAFFTICNFCLTLYVSERWNWGKWQQGLVMCSCLGVYFQFLFWSSLTSEEMNTNVECTIVVFVTFVLFAFIERWFQERRKKVVIEGCLLLAVVWQLYRYHGRGAASAILFFCIMKFVIPNEWWNREKLYHFVIRILTIGSVLFSILYVIAWKLFDPNQVMRIFGKRLFSGRQSIWEEFLLRFAKQPLWGTGTNFTIKSFRMFNVHNSMLDILTIHGVIVFALVLVYIWWKMKRIYQMHPKSPLFITAISGVMAVFLESVTEMDLLWAPQLMLWSLMLMILNSDSDKIQEKEV